MTNTLIVWSILFTIGVFDAREHRIPNLLVLALLLLMIFELATNYPLLTFLDLIKDSSVNFMICFSVSLIIYLCGGMAAGDVKLISAIGFIIGQGSLLDYLQYTSWACVFIGLMYWTLNSLRRCDSSKTQLKRLSSFKNAVPEIISVYSPRTNSLYGVAEATYMPFAPILVIGLAMYQFSLH